VWQQEGISGVKRKMNVLLGKERDAVLYRDSVKLVLDRKQIDEEVEAIRESGLFDDVYYFAMYPEIQPQPQDPIRHYCESDWREGRNTLRMTLTHAVILKRIAISRMLDLIRSGTMLLRVALNPGRSRLTPIVNMRMMYILDSYPMIYG